MKSLDEMRGILANGTTQDFLEALPEYDILTTDGFGNTLLHLYLHQLMEKCHATKLDDWRVYVGNILDMGLPIDIKNKRLGYTPLALSLACHNKALCEYLIYRGADVNEIDRYGKTILLCAVMSAEEMIPLLIEHGANIEALTPQGVTIRNFVCNKLADIKENEQRKLYFKDK